MNKMEIAAAPAAPVDEARERELFEAHFGSALDYRPWNQNVMDSRWFYDCTRTEYAWRGWQAARAQRNLQEGGRTWGSCAMCHHLSIECDGSCRAAQLVASETGPAEGAKS